jgi:hypothetical protein
MLKEVPKGSSTLEAHVGQYVELALPGGGTTGLRWDPVDCEGLAIERLATQPASTFGGRSCEIFLVTPNRKGDMQLVLLLRAPWHRAPSEVREVQFKVR